MQRSNKFVMAAVLLSGLAASGCSKSSTFDNAAAGNGNAAKVQTIKGIDHIRLSATAVRRLGLETGSVSVAKVGGVERKVIPYRAVLYAADGHAYTFVSPSPRSYQEAPITVDRIAGDRAILKRGPATGTAVVTIGSAELIGAARGVEED
jgi:hypothetical protein